MENSSEKFLTNSIISRIQYYYANILKDSSFEELMKKKEILLFRSAKEDVLNKFLDYLERLDYTGTIHIIGRKRDEKVISYFKKLNLSLDVVDEKQKYTIENTKEYIKKWNIEAACFLYQRTISINHKNLIQILNEVPGDGYAVSKQMDIVKFEGLKQYIKGKQIYNALCEWFYWELENNII